jgi:Flp pilus assembly pilin Flp
MIHDQRGTVALEYIVVGGLVIAITAAALIGLFQTLAGKLQEINVNLGS